MGKDLNYNLLLIMFGKIRNELNYSKVRFLRVQMTGSLILVTSLRLFFFCRVILLNFDVIDFALSYYISFAIF